MNGRTWLNYFIQGCKKIENKSNCRGEQWTEFMGKVLDIVGEKMKCYVARYLLPPKKKEWSHEYLDIDAFFFDLRDYDLFPSDNDEDPLTLPSAIVELENDYDRKKIEYCLWKLLCIRSPIRVLICYQKGKDAIQALVQQLDDTIWKGRLLKGDTSDLLLILGDDSKEKETEWREYFTVYEWRNDKLTMIEGLE